MGEGWASVPHLSLTHPPESRPGFSSSPTGGRGPRVSPHLRPISPHVLGMSVPAKRPTRSGRTRCFLRGGGLGLGPFTGHAVPTLWGDAEGQSTRARGPTGLEHRAAQGPPNPDTQHTHTVTRQHTRASPVAAGPFQGVQSMGGGAWPLSHPRSPATTCLAGITPSGGESSPTTQLACAPSPAAPLAPPHPGQTVWPGSQRCLHPPAAPG